MSNTASNIPTTSNKVKEKISFGLRKFALIGVGYIVGKGLIPGDLAPYAVGAVVYIADFAWSWFKDHNKNKLIAELIERVEA